MTRQQHIDCIHKLMDDRETLREALIRIIHHLETLDDPSATISCIAEEALKNTE